MRHLAALQEAINRCVEERNRDPTVRLDRWPGDHRREDPARV
jgi:hypothetical protein